MYALTIFISAFLLFSVQPVISKQILPVFGGSSVVWLISLVFFQTLLLLGYLYSHLIVSYLKIKTRIILHVLLLLFSVFSLPIWSVDNNFHINPYLNILVILLVTVGVPYFMLSTTAPLVQSFFAQNKINNNKVYSLYALSNASCLIALFSYPFVFEPIFSIKEQSQYWSFLYALFVATSIGLLVWSFILNKKNQSINSIDNYSSPKIAIEFNLKIKWMFYAFLASGLLSVITSHVTQNVASIPLFWILPLSIYLISFIISFQWGNLFDKKFLEISLLLIIPIMSFSTYFVWGKSGITPGAMSIQNSAILFLTGLFISCFYLNGLIYQSKPQENQLTQFYVYLAIGGALGAFFVAIVCPLIFTSHVEMPLLFLCLMAVIVFQFKNKKIPVALFFITLFINLMIDIEKSKNLIDAQRGFYGVVSIGEVKDKNILTRYMLHGSILHGMQLINHEEENTPTTYYHLKSGFGQAVSNLQKSNSSIHIGMVGMGVGTAAAYGRQKDKITFFEIDPLVVNMADKHFTYLNNSKALVTSKIGDGRALIEKENKDYDILAIDAFSGDAVPVHLMTSQAVDIYLSKLKNENGILAFHITSGYINLALPLAKIAQDKNLFYGIINSGKDNYLQTEARWLLISKSKIIDLHYSFISPQELKNQSLWTDNYSNLVEVFN